MKYFIDTEFIEGFHKPLFGKRRHFIDLISIGIVCEDGRTYYSISKEYEWEDADTWVRANVILPAYTDYIHGDNRNTFDARNFNRHTGKSNKKIAEEILEFMGCWRDQHFYRVGRDVPEVYGHYADYDWVLFCSLFGRMIDLPKGFPMYCRDLKQMLDVKCIALKETPDTIKELNGFPKQTNEHNALADARWNFELYKFLTPTTGDKK